jgi:thiamine biosynthesis lipoprotein
VRELVRNFACFGSRVELRVMTPREREAEAQSALDLAGVRMRLIHGRLTRFDPTSELSRLNRDRRPRVPASPLLVELAAGVRWAGEWSGGLVDATCLDGVEQAGYRESREDVPGLGRDTFLAAAPREARAATPDPRCRWRLVEADRTGDAIFRNPGIRIDGGGLAKGMAADLAATLLRSFSAYVVDAAGDLRMGGTTRLDRPVQVRDPFDGSVVRELSLPAGAVATSGITRRSWLRSDGSLGHHLIDPGTGLPAWTGLVQATALGPSAAEAEVRAKAALLAGPEHASRHLPDGGVLLTAEGAVLDVERPVELVA